MVLIGHSWGGTLVAHYAAAYPDHVAKLVFHSPGPVWFESFVPFEYQRTDALNPHSKLPPPRISAALVLSYANPAASEDLISPNELGDWELATVDPRELVCKGDADKLPRDFTGATMAGMNMYPLLVTTQELKQKKMDVRPQLAFLHVPAIALEGECDIIPWSDHVQYKKIIPGLQEFYFPDAGHYINLSQPEKLAAVIRSFLLDQPPPFPGYQGDRDPRPPLLKVVGH
jgi:pimeloyl-ACP methyl ester carboxylesterase